MANKVSVEIDARVQGFEQGMSQAIDSCQKYETETRKISEATGNFRKEFAQAKKDVMNLAQAYSKLDATAKASQFGKEMAAQLEAAKQKASEMLDMQGDLNQELKNMASDTRVFDTLSEGMGVFMNATSAALGVVAQFTGNEEDAKKAVVAFTTAQSVLATVTKLQNALQKQSNTMLAVQKVQTLAATAAVNLETAAKSKNIVVSKAATIAQAAFNKVAMANPYVLLATAIIGVTAALAAFIIKSRQSTEEQKRAAAAAELAKQKHEALANALGDTIPTFMKLQSEWRNLRTEADKKQWIEDNKSEFEKLGIAINGVSDAENVLVSNSNAVIQALILRAKAAASAQVVQERYKKYLEDVNKLEGARGKKDMNPNDVKDLGLDTKSKNVKHEGRGWISELYSVDVDKEIKRRYIQWEMEAQDMYRDMNKFNQEANEKLAAANVKSVHKGNEKVTKADKAAAKKRAEEAAKGSVAYAEAMLQGWQNKLKNADASNDVLINNIKSEIAKWQKEVDNRKLKIGMEVKSSDKAKTARELLSEHEKLLKTQEEEAEAALVLANMNHKGVEEIIKLEEAWQKAKKARTDYEATKKLVTEGPEATGSQAISDAKSGKTPKTIEDYQKALSAIEEKMKKLDLGSEEAESLGTLYNQVNQELVTMQENLENLQNPARKAIKQAEKLADRYDLIADAVSSIGDAFSALSELAEDDPALEVVGIIAQAVANMFAGYAQATVAAAQTGNPWVWAAFAAAGLAQTLAMVAQIKSAAQFAEGGIVGGSSYSGDKIYSRLNSGEMILNQRQQKNLFNLLDQDVMPQRGGTNVHVEGVIRGTDLLLVQQNTNKIRSKAGTQIHF